MVILYSPRPHRKCQNTQLQIRTYHTIDNSLVCIATACMHYKWLNYSTMLMYLLCLWQRIGWHKITRYICLSIKIVHGVYYNYIINIPVTMVFVIVTMLDKNILQHRTWGACWVVPLLYLWTTLCCTVTYVWYIHAC